MNTAQARAAGRALMTGEVPLVAAPRFKACAARFLAHGFTSRGRPLRPTSLRAYRFVLETVAAPLHSAPVTEIRRGAVAKLVHEAAQQRGAATAALTRSALSRFFGWLVEVDEIEVSPATRSPIYSAERGRRVLSDPEIAAIWGTDGPFGSVLRLLLLTGARRSEVGGMRWSEIDGDVWVIPPERVKTHRALTLPLPPAAIIEIRRQPKILGRDQVFGHGSAQGFTGWGTHKELLDRHLGLTKTWRLHDLRRTARTRLHALGVPYEVVAHIFNHDLGAISSTYDHYGYQSEMREALNKWAAEIERMVQQLPTRLAAHPAPSAG